MTDADLIRKKLARVESCVSDIRRLTPDPALIARDLVLQRFVEHTLQIAIQSALDVASHIVSGERLGEPASNHALFDLLSRSGWIAPETVPVLRAMVGFRNVLVHEYDDVDLAIVRDVVEHRLDDLLEFVVTVRERIGDD